MLDLDKSYVNRLLYFYFVASCKNISYAAREVGLHQSALSRQMIKFEKEIGIPLMKRHKNGIALTRKGEELFDSAKRIFTEVQATRKKLNEEEGIGGKIRICTTYAIANYILGEHLIEFQKLFPSIYFDVVCNDYTIDIIKNDVDVVIRPYDSNTENILQEPLFNIQPKLYASKSYIEKNGFPYTIMDLKNHKFITSSRASILPFDSKVDWFLDINESISKANCIMETNSVELDYQAARKGMGIISAYENMSIFKESGLIQIAPEVVGKNSPHYFTYSKQLVDNLKIKELKKFLLEKLN